MPANPLLSQAPLIHVVAQVHFSELPPFEESVLEGLHRRLVEAGFPERVDANLSHVEWSVQLSVENEPQQRVRDIQRVVFKGAGQRSLVELRQDRLLLKTTDYSGHEAFLEDLHELMCIVAEVLPGFNKGLLHRLSLRYVDLVVPKPDEKLRELVSEALLPPPLPDVGGSPLFGSTVKVVDTGMGRHLRVMFEEVQPEEGKLTKVLPDDLAEHVRSCGLSITAQEHWESISGVYGLLDIEHVHIAGDTPVVGNVDKSEIFRQLHEKTYRAFWGVITKQAQRSWK